MRLGANPPDSGVGVLLELARLFATAPLTPTLTLIAFGGEEDGLAGSHYFVSNLPPGARFEAQGMLNFDCVGVGDALHLYYVNTADRTFAEALPVAPDRIDRLLYGSSDHRPFSEGGIPSVMFNINSTEGACGPDYHQPTDTADRLERPAIARAGQAGVTAVQHLIDAAPPRTAALLYLPAVYKTPAGSE